MEQTKELNRTERRELLIDAIIIPYGWMRPNEPFFRFWDKLPKRMKEGLAQLKSDDIKHDNWHLR